MVEAQKKYPDEFVGFVDCEQAFDKEYAEKLGLDTSEDRFWFVQPDSANQAIDVLLKFAESGAFSLIALDSIPALIPEQNLNAEVGDVQVASAARLLSNELRRVMTATKKTNTATILINQWRSNIGFTGGDKAMPGGQAMKYYPSVTIDLKRKELQKKGDDFISADIQANFIKNRFGLPFAKAVYRLVFGEGIKKDIEVVEVAKELGIIEGKNWYTFPISATETNRLQGIQNVIDWYKENPEAFAYLENLVISSFVKNKVETISEEDLEYIGED